MPQSHRKHRKDPPKVSTLKTRALSAGSEMLASNATWIPATRAKNEFAGILDDVLKGKDVVITKHSAARAVVISVEKFNSLTKQASTDLATLTAQFNQRLEKMQTPEARTALHRAFNATPSELGRVALKAMRSR